MKLSGIVWITGEPFAGKTAVASRVQRILSERHGVHPIHLDGDLLRLLLDRSNVESEDGRRSLGTTYVRIAKALARQECLVLVSAVAIYREVFEELRADPACPHLIFHLSVDKPSWRRRSGSHQRNVQHASSVNFSELPHHAIEVENGDGTNLNDVAEYLVTRIAAENSPLSGKVSFMGVQREIWAFGRAPQTVGGHWNAFYRSAAGQAVSFPSPFATWMSETFRDSLRGVIVDFGCGNGRDTVFLSNFGPSLRVDASAEAILECERRWGVERTAHSLSFIQGDHQSIGEVLNGKEISLFYSRFVWHAMPLESELSVLEAIRRELSPGALLAIEARTARDQLASRGARLSENERILGHYRRFVDVEELCERIYGANCEVVEVVQGQGFAVLGDEDPHVVRVVARKLS